MSKQRKTQQNKTTLVQSPFIRHCTRKRRVLILQRCRAHTEH